MATYLLTWNSDKWAESDLLAYINQYKAGNKILRWSCGTTKKIISGDRVYLMRRGKVGVRGLFGSGHVVSEKPFSDKHFSQSPEYAHESLYVDVNFDYLVNPNEKVIINRETLINKFPAGVWNSQGTGKTIPPLISSELDKLWLERIGGSEILYPDEAGIDEMFTEGGKKSVFVNMYERNPTARMKCIQHHGVSCEVCGFHFKSFYGNLGEGYIHVHHLKPISSIGDQYEVDPIKDLRPVCPNCHAMLHKNGSSISIDELQSLINSYGFHPRYKKL